MTKRRIAGVVLAGLLLVGCGDTDSGIPNQDIPNINVNNNQPVVVNPPVAGSFSFSTSNGAQVVRAAANGLLSVGTPNGANVVSVQSPTTLGGTVTSNADGSFTYNPPAQVGVTDSFSFTIQNSAGNSTGTANVSLILPRFFVNNQAAAGGDGSQAAPFQTLAQAQTAATGVNGAEIVVFPGDGTSNGYNTALALGGNQTLRGFSQAARPVLTGPVSCVGGNRLEDLSFANAVSPINSVNASNSTGGGVVNRVSFSSSRLGCNVTNSTGTWLVDNCSFANISVAGVAGSSTAGNLGLVVNNSSFDGASSGPLQFFQVDASGSLTVTNCTLVNRSFITFFGTTTGTRADLTVANCNLVGAGVTDRGMALSYFGNTTGTARVTNNNLTDFTVADIVFGAGSNSSVTALFDGNRLSGTTAVLSVSSAQTARLCALIRNNVANLFRLRQDNTAASIQVEDFANFGTVNVGTLSTTNTITDVPLGTCGFP